jgi:hypothetical protein
MIGPSFCDEGAGCREAHGWLANIVGCSIGLSGICCSKADLESCEERRKEITLFSPSNLSPNIYSMLLPA